MANQCGYCEQRHVLTNVLILNQGEIWLEFCEACGNKESLTNTETGETLTVRQLFDRCMSKSES
jgi:translation initiation factor 2 beta subunit (eIF-2beta)/eIF-5